MFNITENTYVLQRSRLAEYAKTLEPVMVFVTHSERRLRPENVVASHKIATILGHI